MLQLLKDETAESSRILAELAVSYARTEFKIYRSNDAERFITCIVAIFPDVMECIQQWQNINDTIAIVSQQLLKGNAAPWNLYFLISTPKMLPKDIKYRIENDRYAARKITTAHYELPDDAPDPYLAFIENIILARNISIKKIAASNSIEGSAISETEQVDQGAAKVIKEFIFSKDGLIPQDRKPGSVELRKQYVREMISLVVKT